MVGIKIDITSVTSSVNIWKSILLLWYSLVSVCSVLQEFHVIFLINRCCCQRIFKITYAAESGYHWYLLRSKCHFKCLECYILVWVSLALFFWDFDLNLYNFVILAQRIINLFSREIIEKFRNDIEK